MAEDRFVAARPAVVRWSPTFRRSWIRVLEGRPAKAGTPTNEARYNGTNDFAATHQFHRRLDRRCATRVEPGGTVRSCARRRPGRTDSSLMVAGVRRRSCGGAA